MLRILLFFIIYFPSLFLPNSLAMDKKVILNTYLAEHLKT